MTERKNRKPDVFDRVILIFSLVLLVLAGFTFFMKWWIGT